MPLKFTSSSMQSPLFLQGLLEHGLGDDGHPKLIEIVEKIIIKNNAVMTLFFICVGFIFQRWLNLSMPLLVWLSFDE